MMATLALAAVLASGGELYYDELGCKWRHAPVVAKAPHKPASAASSPRPKPKKRPTWAKPAAPVDEFIGCEEAAPAPPLTAIAPPTFDEAPFSPVPLLPDPPPILSLAPPPAETFEQGCDCAGGVPVVFFVPIGGGPILVPAPAAPIPEPSTWALLGIGLLAAAWWKTGRGSS